jgi:hypothetical protein
MIGMNDKDFPSNLPESEALEHTSLEARSAQRTIQHDNVMKLSQFRIDIVCVSVARHDSCLHGLQQTIQHPRTGRTFRMSRQILLKD